MKDIHFLFYITSKTYFVIYNAKLTLIYRKTQFCFDCAVSGQRSPSVPLHGTIQRSLNSVSISYHVTLYHPIK